MLFFVILSCVLVAAGAVPVDLPPSSTITAADPASQTPIVPADWLADTVPVDGYSFFSISSSCFRDTGSSKVRPGYANRGKFYTQAIKDATEIADAATKWPQFGSDVSDLYFGQGMDTSIYAQNITENLKAAADWDHPRWGFDPYIILTCDDPASACGGKIGNDPRSIGCYVNNTADLFSTISRISCCAPFFQLDNINQVFEANVGADTSTLGLNYMRTSGSYLLHEMMHTTKITQTRPLVIDRIFDGSLRKRIYGPPDVAKAARTLDNEITATNADSYATFALAMYWKDVLGGLIQPSTPNPAPINYTDLISDNDNNYISLVVANPPVCAGTPTDKPSADKSYVQAQISDYCSYTTSAGWIINTTTGVYGPKGYAAGFSAPASDNDLWISIAFDPRCSPDVAYTVAQSDCETNLGTVLDSCNTDDTTETWGGQLAANCALWNITTRFGHSSTPPNGFP